MRKMTDQYGRTWTDEDSKKCCKCKEQLSVKAFGGRTRVSDYCRTCARIVNKLYQEEHREQIRASNNAAAARRYRRNSELLDVYCADKACVDCGETDPIVFEFDHRDRSTKKEKIANMLGVNCWETIMAEIEKCDIRCANCHRRRTAIQLGWRVKGGGAQ